MMFDLYDRPNVSGLTQYHWLRRERAGALDQSRTTGMLDVQAHGCASAAGSPLRVRSASSS